MLMERLGVVGLADDGFMEAVRSCADSDRQVNREVVNMLLAIDDFELFVNIMYRRNVELEAMGYMVKVGHAAASVEKEGSTAPSVSGSACGPAEPAAPSGTGYPEHIVKGMPVSDGTPGFFANFTDRLSKQP